MPALYKCICTILALYYITFFWECLSPSISIKHHRCLPFSYLCPLRQQIIITHSKKTNLFSTTVGTHNKQDISTHIHSTQYSEVDDQELGNHKFKYECVYIKKKHNLVSLQCNAHMTPLSQSDTVYFIHYHIHIWSNSAVWSKGW